MQEIYLVANISLSTKIKDFKTSPISQQIAKRAFAMHAAPSCGHNVKLQQTHSLRPQERVMKITDNTEKQNVSRE